MPAPSSALFHVESSLSTGRRIHASQDLPAQTPLLTTADLAGFIIFHEYRKEVCSYCFAYEHGRSLGVRDNEVGLAWCSENCRSEWVDIYGAEALEAFKKVEALSRKSAASRGSKAVETDSLLVPAQNLDAPTAEDVDSAWLTAHEQGALMTSARCIQDTKPTKAARKALQAALSSPVDHTTICHLLSGVLLQVSKPELWASMLELYAASTPYADAEQLAKHITAYYQLLAVLPPNLMVSCTTEIMRATQSRDLPNSFGIRSLDDAGAEIFGYGVWPEASYWNHSCEPNIQKRRVGRAWEFWLRRDVKQGDELSITYLGGDEDVLDVIERRKRLMTTWGFTCMCRRCVCESAEREGPGL
jgi:hypothetical protein